MRLCLGRNYIEWEPFHQRGRRNRQWRQTGMYFQQSVSFFPHCFPPSLPLSFLVSVLTSFTSFLSCLLSLDVDLWLACLTLQTNLGGTILDAVTSSKVELSQGKGADDGENCCKQKLSTKYDLIPLLIEKFDYCIFFQDHIEIGQNLVHHLYRRSWEVELFQSGKTILKTFKC